MTVAPSVPATSGRLSSARRAGILAAVVAIVVAIVATLVVVPIPLAGPDLALGGAAMHADPSSRTFVQDYLIVNEGRHAATVVGASSAVPGTAMVDSSLREPVHLGPGSHFHLVMRFHVTDCATARSGPVPVLVKVSYWWGTKTAIVRDHGGPYGPPMGDAHTACTE